MDKEAVRKEAKALMDEFMDALEKAPEAEEKVGIEREDNTRVPEKPELSEGFPGRMLRNAPKKKDNFIVAEKKSW